MTKYLIALALLAAACGDKEAAEEPAAPAAEPAQATEGHSHAKGPWGGTVVILGDHEGHIEVVSNHTGGAVTIYAYDKDMNEVALDEPPVLNFVSADGPQQLTGEGEDAEWIFYDESLKKEFKQLRFRLVLGGKAFTPVLEHVH